MLGYCLALTAGVKGVCIILLQVQYLQYYMTIGYKFCDCTIVISISLALSSLMPPKPIENNKAEHIQNVGSIKNNIC